jgi:serine/threonine protein kinase
LHELEKQLSAGPTSLNIEVSEEAKTEKKYDTQKFSESEKSDSVRTEMWETIGAHSFTAHELLGTGSFGEVYLVEKISNRSLHAMKVLSKDKIAENKLAWYALTERNVMVTVTHPFIVKLNYAF